jgi:oligopeptide transport system substrate-binding protein
VARQSWVATVEDPIDFLELFQYRNDSKLGGNNDTSWHNDRFCELIDRAKREPSERAALLLEAERLLLEEMPVIPLFFCHVNYLINPKLEEICLSRLGRLDFKWSHWCDM